MARQGREYLSRWTPASLRQEALVQQALQGFEVVPRHRGRLMLRGARSLRHSQAPVDTGPRAARVGEDSIHFEHRGGPCRDPERHNGCPGIWRGAVSLGYTPDGQQRIRRRVAGKTNDVVRNRTISG
jgi:hypothetical protein